MQNYLKETTATMAIAFALLAPIIVGASGMALDVAQAYLVKERLANALDAAALAGAASSSDEAEIRQRVIDFFETNFPEDALGVTVTPDIQVIDDQVIVTGHAYYYTMFLRVLGIETIDLDEETTVQRQIQGVEVVLVMDNTGSMGSTPSGSNKSNIQALKDSAESFVNIMFSNVSNDALIKIGLVPFAATVNVGPYGLGENPDGSTYNDGTEFVNRAGDPGNEYYYSATDGDQWKGCVFESTANDGDYPLDTQDREGPWDMFGYERQKYVAVNYNTDYCYGSGWRSQCYELQDYWYEPGGCPTPMTPMTNDQDQLLDNIDDMNASGVTLGNIGMVWGYRMISETEPFTEGTSYDSLYWKKAIIMMTDGNNVMGSFTAYEDRDDHNLNADDLNDRFADVCENAKDDGINIYTIIFTSNINNDTKDMFRDCATDEDKYFFAPDQDDLEDVYEQIARELSNLHIKS